MKSTGELNLVYGICCSCGSYAINPHCHGREPGVDLNLCDVCYWRSRAEKLNKERADHDIVMPHPVLAIGKYRNNAELIEAASRLGYVGDSVLDLSYGYGSFWDVFHPKELVKNDLNPSKGDVHFDVRGKPQDEWLASFDTVVWDGPYRLNGTSDRGYFDEAFGTNENTKLKEKINLLLLGVVFASQCVRRGGYVLVKCQDQVAAGKKQQQRRMVQDVGALFGLKWVDELHLVTGVRSQRTQKTSRSNFSTLVVMSG